MNLSIIGFGLIGGSIARAIRERAGSPWRVVAWSPSGNGPRAALERGVIDAAPAAVADVLAGADLVVLAAPPIACLELLAELGGPLRDLLPAAAVVTDVASTKVRIMDAAATVGLRFVGGHPMAGRDTSGFGSADAGLFVDRPWVIVAGDSAPDAVARVESLARRVGARPLALAAQPHDTAVAGISHLPLVLAAALAEAVIGGPDGSVRPDWPVAHELAASGWRDMTRLARGDPDMGAGIAATNGPALAARLRDLRLVLDSWLDMLEREAGPDSAALEARLRAVRAQLDEPP